MTDEGRRRIPIVDRRVAHQSESSPGVEPPTSASAGAPAADADTPPTGPDASAFGLGVDGPHGTASDPPPPSEENEQFEQQNFLDDLKRLQADFDNYRKRMMREQAATSTRAKARLMEQLLPVLDDCERALEHDDSSGMELIYKQLRSTLEAEGLEEIEAEGKAFDPTVHEAIDSREDPGVSETVVQSVFRRGYRVGEQVLRAAMVVVARPPESNENQQETEAGPAPAAEE